MIMGLLGERYGCTRPLVGTEEGVTFIGDRRTVIGQGDEGNEDREWGGGGERVQCRYQY